MGNRTVFQVDETTSLDKILLSTTLNALKIQMYCAIIAYNLVAIIGNRLKVERSIYEILQIHCISILNINPVNAALTECD